MVVSWAVSRGRANVRSWICNWHETIFQIGHATSVKIKLGMELVKKNTMKQDDSTLGRMAFGLASFEDLGGFGGQGMKPGMKPA